MLIKDMQHCSGDLHRAAGAKAKQYRLATYFYKTCLKFHAQSLNFTSISNKEHGRIKRVALEAIAEATRNGFNISLKILGNFSLSLPILHFNSSATNDLGDWFHVIN